VSDNTFDRELQENMKDPEFAAAFHAAQAHIAELDAKANHTPEGDYIEQDTADESNYCKHGNFIGNPYGGDYLCHYCEMGE
jgi:hypothetical protein